MTAGQLKSVLRFVDDDTEIGTCLANINGYVQKVTGIFTTEFDGKKILAIDGSDEAISPNELNLKELIFQTFKKPT